MIIGIMRRTVRIMRTGPGYNYSWNCGVEGPTRRKAVRQLRMQQIRNAYLLLLLSQGTPMIYGGDEFGNY